MPDQSSAQSSGRCERIMIGLGNDTYDPLCVKPAGHGGPCAQECSEPGCEKSAPVANFGGLCEDHLRRLLA